MSAVLSHASASSSPRSAASEAPPRAGYRLLYQTHSPYARKVLVAAHELGLADRIEVVHHETSPTRRNPEVHARNPLGKVPVLLGPDDLVLYDSSVICEYLDGLHDGPPLIPASGAARWRALRLQALAQGMADAGIAVRWEQERRPEALRWDVMREAQREKIAQACDAADREVRVQARPDIGDVALAASISWLLFREVLDCLARRPALAEWYAWMAQRPGMLATPLEGQTHD
ncbi:glutathione S-transferase family protein [Pseudomonadota bacterium AL_CKDN230030165-1A_HGKHYDSX7]